MTVTLSTPTDDQLRLTEMQVNSIWRWASGVAADEVTPK